MNYFIVFNGIYDVTLFKKLKRRDKINNEI
jgi:hypothetical protein